jgi:hypothetical protein
VASKLIESAEEFVRLRVSERQDEYSIAADAEAPMEVWFDIIARFPEMKEWVACNRTVPMEILEVLASDSDRKVRAAVADKRKLSSHLFDLLSKDADEVVRQRIAYNKKSPIEVIERLAIDEAALVRTAALRRLKPENS